MMVDGNFKIINWDDAGKTLHNIIGVHVKDLAELSHSNNKPQYCLKIDNWYDLYDLDIYRKICANLSSKKKYIISDLSYSKDMGVFCIEDNIEPFISFYNSAYHEFIFEDDAFLIFPDEKKMIVYQHEGYYMLYTLPLTSFP